MIFTKKNTNDRSRKPAHLKCQQILLVEIKLNYQHSVKTKWKNLVMLSKQTF